MNSVSTEKPGDPQNSAASYLHEAFDRPP